MALLCSAVTQARSHSDKQDIVHVSAHFVVETIVGPYEVYVRPIRDGKSFDNIEATLSQRVKFRLVSAPSHV